MIKKFLARHLDLQARPGVAIIGLVGLIAGAALFVVVVVLLWLSFKVNLLDAGQRAYQAAAGCLYDFDNGNAKGWAYNCSDGLYVSFRSTTCDDAGEAGTTKTIGSDGCFCTIQYNSSTAGSPGKHNVTARGICSPKKATGAVTDLDIAEVSITADVSTSTVPCVPDCGGTYGCLDGCGSVCSGVCGAGTCNIDTGECE